MIDYPKSQALAVNLLKVAGLQVTIKRDTQLVKCYGVFTNASNNDFADQGGPVSGVVSAQRILLLPGNLKMKPAVGDIVSCKQGDFRIQTVELVQPGAVPILYRVEVSQ